MCYDRLFAYYHNILSFNSDLNGKINLYCLKNFVNKYYMATGLGKEYQLTHMHLADPLPI